MNMIFNVYRDYAKIVQNIKIEFGNLISFKVKPLWYIIFPKT